MSRSRIGLTSCCIALFVFFLGIRTPGQDRPGQPATIEIDAPLDSRFLPYEANLVWSNDLPGTRRLLVRPVHVWTMAPDTGSDAVLLMAHNPALEIDQPSTVNWYFMPSYRILEEHPVPYSINDIVPATYPSTGEQWAVCVGSRNDSAFLFQLRPGDREPRVTYLDTGEDITGNGYWDSQISIRNVVDLDMDGDLEALVFLTSGRDMYPRKLFCIDLERDSVRWSLPVASNISVSLQVRPDTLAPRVAFVTSCPAQGARDALFDDYYAYFAILDGFTGTPLVRRVVSHYPERAEIAWDPDREIFYISHCLPPTEDTIGLAEAALQPRLSVVSIDGTFLETIANSAFLANWWLQDYDYDGADDLYQVTRDGRLNVFASDLTLLAVGEAATIGGYAGRGPALGPHEYTLIIHERDATVALYAPDLEKLVELGEYVTIALIQPQPDSEHALIVASQGQRSQKLVRIEHRNFIDYAIILYLDYRNYILAVLFALIVGLAVVNFYRVRTRRNLRTIAEQKTELEKAHRELREAQQRIIDAEKQKQAQEIAGGFAHEIRNALLPAEIAHRKIRALLPDQTDSLRNAERAVTRALSLVNMITTYTSIEERKSLQPTSIRSVLDEIVADIAGRIESAGVRLEPRVEPAMMLAIDREHLYMVLANLITNSLDALGQRGDGVITIEGAVGRDYSDLSVKDNGPGISEKILPRMFEPFVSSRPRDGHGIGLALVRRLVLVYEGTIAAENRPEGGAVVRVRFPAPAPGDRP